MDNEPHTAEYMKIHKIFCEVFIKSKQHLTRAFSCVLTRI